MANFRKPRDIMAAINRDINNIKGDVLAALGAEMSQKMSLETNGEIKVSPKVSPNSVRIEYNGSGEEEKVKRHKNALKNLKDHFEDNMEEILKRRKVI